MELIGLLIIMSLSLMGFLWVGRTYADLYRENQELREEIVHIIAERDCCNCDESVKVVPNTNQQMTY